MISIAPCFRIILTYYMHKLDSTRQVSGKNSITHITQHRFIGMTEAELKTKSLHILHIQIKSDLFPPNVLFSFPFDMFKSQWNFWKMHLPSQTVFFSTKNAIQKQVTYYQGQFSLFVVQQCIQDNDNRAPIPSQNISTQNIKVSHFGTTTIRTNFNNTQLHFFTDF